MKKYLHLLIFGEPSFNVYVFENWRFVNYVWPFSGHQALKGWNSMGIMHLVSSIYVKFCGKTDISYPLIRSEYNLSMDKFSCRSNVTMLRWISDRTYGKTFFFLEKTLEHYTIVWLLKQFGATLPKYQS